MSRRTNPLGSLAVAYSWRQLARRAGIPTTGSGLETGFENLGISVFYDHPEKLEVNSPCVIVIPCDSGAWYELLSKKPHSLPQFSMNEVTPKGIGVGEEVSIPVLFWGQGYDGHQFAELRDNKALIFYADIIATTFFMLSRWEEAVTLDQDEHGRFPARASVAYKQGFLDRPVVDEYALILREWLRLLLPGWAPQARSFSIQLSHDVDHVVPFQNLLIAFRSIGAELFKRRQPCRAFELVADTMAQVMMPEQTSCAKGIRYLADFSHKHGLSDDIFYFMADGPGPFGGGYNPAAPLVRKQITEVRKQGFEIGLHASYYSLGNEGRILAEKSRLEAVLGDQVRAVRQHYMRFRVPDSWQQFDEAGLTLDSTMAYVDHEGFRCGTCYPYSPFDIQNNRELNLKELPLIAADTTLHGYRGLSPTQGKTRILQLARRCRRVGGTFTLLWHNSSLSGKWRAWIEIYRQVVKELGNW